jgi:hypothetical protein
MKECEAGMQNEYSKAKLGSAAGFWSTLLFA